MNDIIPCLFDTNAIIKYYHDIEKGAGIVKYLFDSSQTLQINITDLHILEVIGVFHSVCKRKEINEDERDKSIDTFLGDVRDRRILPYEFTPNHIPNFFNISYTAFSIDPPKTKKKIWIPFTSGWATKLKDVADSNDIAMLTIMKEIQNTVGESYLFTSDGHVKKIAQAMRLLVLDVEEMSFDDIPFSLDNRGDKRKKIDIKAICHDYDNGAPLGSKRTVDISNTGACILFDKPLEVGKLISIQFIRDSNHYQVKSRVVRCEDDNKFAFKFENPSNIPLATLS